MGSPVVELRVEDPFARRIFGNRIFEHCEVQIDARQVQGGAESIFGPFDLVESFFLATHAFEHAVNQRCSEDDDHGREHWVRGYDIHRRHQGNDDGGDQHEQQRLTLPLFLQAGDRIQPLALDFAIRVGKIVELVALPTTLGHLGIRTEEIGLRRLFGWLDVVGHAARNFSSCATELKADAWWPRTTASLPLRGVNSKELDLG